MESLKAEIAAKWKWNFTSSTSVFRGLRKNYNGDLLVVSMSSNGGFNYVKWS